MNLSLLILAQASQGAGSRTLSELTVIEVIAVLGGLAVLAGVIAGGFKLWSNINSALAERDEALAKKMMQMIAEKSEATPVSLPQPLEIRAAKQFVNRGDYERDQGVTDARLKSATDSRKKMHEKLDDHGQRIALLEKSEQHHETLLAAIDTKLTTILQRLPRIQP